jgi:hypothetical protein
MLDRRDLTLQPLQLLSPFTTTLTALSPSASPRRDHDLSLRVQGSRIRTCGARIRMSVGIAVRRLACGLMSPNPPRVGNLIDALFFTGL